MRWLIQPPRQQHSLHQQLKFIHSSASRRAPPVIVVMLMKPILKLATALTARAARRKWGKVNPETKAKVQAYFTKRKRWLLGSGIGCCAGCLGYYAWHLERAPLTGRLRVVTISADRLNEYSRLELNNILEDAVATGGVHSFEHPYSRRVVEIVQSLLPAALNYFPDSPKHWHIHVLKDDETVNAMCYSTGDIFVYSGMLKFVENDHQLAFILAHEMAHVLIGHSREHLTFGNAVYSLILLPLTALTWLFVPDIFAALGYVVQEELVSLFFHMPFSRRLEHEADSVGLQIASASCYDPMEAARFWELMDFVEEASESQVPEFLSTHPLSCDRAKALRALQDHAMAVRSACGCHPLGLRAKETDYERLMKAGKRLSAKRLSGVGSRKVEKDH